jgi:predicted GIY-YIG superfamily endonuclease
MKHSHEYTAFNKAMKTILRADPAAVKEAIEREQRAKAAEREAKGERKRGRKPKSAEHGA